MHGPAILAGTASLMLAVSAPAMAQPTAPAGTTAATSSVTASTSAHRWGTRPNGRWYAGWGAPGGWGGYRRPVNGAILPSYWINPAYYLADYRTYGLPAPTAGYGWSRYFDDAVMTDQYGRIYDSRSNIDWARYEGGYADGANKPAASRNGATFDDRYADDAVTYSASQRSGAAAGNDQSGWTGSWSADGQTYNGTYHRAGAAYDAPAAIGATHWTQQQPAPMLPPGVPPGGYISGGYYYPPATVTTVIIDADGKTRTTTSYAPAKGQ